MDWNGSELRGRLNRVLIREFEVFETEEEVRRLLGRAYDTPSLWSDLLDVYEEIGGNRRELRAIYLGKGRPLILTRRRTESVNNWAQPPVDEAA